MKAEAFASAHADFPSLVRAVEDGAAMKAEAFASAHTSRTTALRGVWVSRNEGGGFRLRARTVEVQHGTSDRVAAMKAEAFASAHSRSTWA